MLNQDHTQKEALKTYFSIAEYEEKRQQEEIFRQARLSSRSTSALRVGRNAEQELQRWEQDLEEIGTFLREAGEKVLIIHGIKASERSSDLRDFVAKQEKANREQHPSFYDTQYPDLLKAGDDVYEIAREVKRSGAGELADFDKIKERMREARGGLYFTANFLLGVEDAIDAIEWSKGSLPMDLLGVKEDIQIALARLKQAEEKYRLMENRQVSLQGAATEEKNFLSAA